MNKSDKNTIPIFKIWTMTNIALRLTGQTSLRVHRLHRTIGRHINKKPCKNLQKSLKEYLAEAEVKPGEKSYTVIDHLAQELIPYKVASSARSRRISIDIKGTLLTVNVLILLSIECQFHIMPDPHKGVSTQRTIQQHYAKPRHQPSDRDQQARDKL